MENRKEDLTQYTVIRATRAPGGTRYVVDGAEHEWLTTAIMDAIDSPVVCRSCCAVFRWHRRAGVCPVCGVFADRQIMIA